MTPLLVLAALAAWQMLLVAYSATSAENAARAASRVIALSGDPARTARSTLPAALRHGVSEDTTGTRATVHVRVPIIVPGVDSGTLTVTRSAELPGG